MHLIGRGHFRSPDKEGGHTIGSAIPKNPMPHANATALSFSRFRQLAENFMLDIHTTQISVRSDADYGTKNPTKNNWSLACLKQREMLQSAGLIIQDCI